MAQDRKDQQRQIISVIDGLDVSVFGVLRSIQSVIAAANLSDAEKLASIEKFLKHSKTEDFDRLKDDLAETASNDILMSGSRVHVEKAFDLCL